MNNEQGAMSKNYERIIPYFQFVICDAACFMG